MAIRFSLALVLVVLGAIMGPTPQIAHSVEHATTVAVKVQRLHCFRAPRACGYPDSRARYPAAAYVGPHNARTTLPCSALRHSGSITITTPGQMIRNLYVTGRIDVQAPDVTIDNVCIRYNGAGNIGSPPAVEFEATGGKIENSDIAGANATSESMEIALGENVARGYTLTASHDFLHNCGECVHNDGWTLTDSYVVANGDPCSSGYQAGRCQGGADHREAVYCDSGSFTARHDTLLDPVDETAALFCNVNNGSGGPCANRITLTQSLLAGGSWVIIPCAHGTGVGTSRMTVVGNDVARCGIRSIYQPATGGSTCGTADRPATNRRGYWPQGGYFGAVDAAYCPPTVGQKWAHNFWDDTGGPIACP